MSITICENPFCFKDHEAEDRKRTQEADAARRVNPTPTDKPKQVCPECHGGGLELRSVDGPAFKCSECRGTGQVLASEPKRCRDENCRKWHDEKDRHKTDLPLPPFKLKAQPTPKPAEGELLEAAGDELGIYAPTNGHCGICGQRPYQHTCDQALEAIQRWYGSKDK